MFYQEPKAPRIPPKSMIHGPFLNFCCQEGFVLELTATQKEFGRERPDFMISSDY